MNLVESQVHVHFTCINLMSEWIFLFFRFLEDLEEGIFIQQTLDSVLMNEDGKQLMVGHLIIIKRGIVPFVLWLMMVVHCYQQ